MPVEQAGGDVAVILDHDGVGKDIAILFGIGLLFQIKRLSGHLDGVIGFFSMAGGCSEGEGKGSGQQGTGLTVMAVNSVSKERMKALTPSISNWSVTALKSIPSSGNCASCARAASTS